MPNVFIISDTHFGHRKILEYSNRPFTSVEEMDEALVANWNLWVKPEDKVYHLGDVAMPRRGLQHVKRLNGRKILIKGNHDNWKPTDLLGPGMFADIRAVCQLGGFLMSHVPIHPDQLGRFKFNVHGHLHERVLPDPHYVNVCVEQPHMHGGYVPLELTHVLTIIRMRELALEEALDTAQSVARS